MGALEIVAIVLYPFDAWIKFPPLNPVLPPHGQQNFLFVAVPRSHSNCYQHDTRIVGPIGHARVPYTYIPDDKRTFGKAGLDWWPHSTALFHKVVCKVDGHTEVFGSSCFFSRGL